MNGDDIGLLLYIGNVFGSFECHKEWFVNIWSICMSLIYVLFAFILICDFIVIQLLLCFFFNWDFNLNLFIKSINCDLLFLWLVSFNMLILKFLKVTRGAIICNFLNQGFQCVHEYRNQMEMTFMNTYDMYCSSFFNGNCSYYIFKSMSLCFKNVRAFVCCTSLSNRAQYKLRYRNILMYLWIFVCHLTIVFLFPKYVKHVILIGCGHDLYLDNVVVKNLYWRLV
jgi:hypothetical protein